MGQQFENSIWKNSVLTKLEKTTPEDYLVSFSGLAKSYCVGLVDMANSTKISANMGAEGWCRYYELFLNAMGSIVKRFDGSAIKNLGDSLLFYFPESSKQRKFGFLSSIECCVSMIEKHDTLCDRLKNENLPCLDYRVSADFGKVVLMNSSNSSATDLIGPPVNMCTKINHEADDNGVIIGNDLYQNVKNFEDYSFKLKKGFSAGQKFSYPIYSITRNE